VYEAEMKRETVKALEQLKVGDQVELWEAAKAIAKHEDAAAVPELLELVRTSPEVERQIAAAWILGSLRSSAALEPLIRIVDNKLEPTKLRDQAAESLGYLSDARARAVLIGNLSDENVDVAFSCVFALRTVGKPEDIPQLERLAHSSSVANSYGASLAQEAREAIEQIRNKDRSAPSH
jgi:HEAT repeat protein